MVGVMSGIAGTVLGMLLKLIQHSAFGYSTGQIVSNENFLEGVRAVLPSRRFLVVSQRIPLTAVILTIEFTHIDFKFIVPTMLYIGISSVSAYSFRYRPLIYRSAKNIIRNELAWD